MRYKVIKNFGVAEKGDVFETDDYGLVTFNITNKDDHGEYTRSMSIDEDTADWLVEEGKLEKVEEDEVCDTECMCDKIQYTVGLIDGLLEKYKQNNEEVNEKANKGEIPPCVKVEADTVYYNLNKVLNRIKKELVDE